MTLCHTSRIPLHPAPASQQPPLPPVTAPSVVAAISRPSPLSPSRLPPAAAAACVMDGKLQLGGRVAEESVQGVTDYSHSKPVSWGDTVVSVVEHPEVIPQCLRDPTVGARRPPCGGVAHLTSFPEVFGLDAEGRELIPTCQSPSCLADSPPRRCACCGPYGYGRCINWAEPVGVGPHRSGMLCANCVPTQGDSKCGCLCGECEEHDYNTEASPASPRHTPRSGQHKRSTPERRTGLLGGSDADPPYSTTTPSSRRRNSPSPGRSVRARFARLTVTDHEFVRNSDVYVARSTLNMNSTPKQRGRRGYAGARRRDSGTRLLFGQGRRVGTNLLRSTPPTVRLAGIRGTPSGAVESGVPTPLHQSRRSTVSQVNPSPTSA